MLHVNASVDSTVDADTLFEVIGDLGRYPSWLDIVANAEPVDDDPGPEPVWLVDLRAQMGPFRRSKRLRMVRTTFDPPNCVRFERRELDGRSHSDWVLTATLDEIEDGAVRLTMDLRYGGALWIPALDRILREEIRRSSERLVVMVGGSD